MIPVCWTQTKYSCPW